MSARHFRLLICFWLALLFHAASAAAGEMVVRDPAQKYILDGAVDVLEDPGSRLSIEDVTGGAAAARFRANADDRIFFGFTKSAWWVRVTVKNETPEDRDWLLGLLNPHLNHSELYVPDGAGGYRVRRGGTRYPFEIREVIDPYLQFPVKIGPGEVATFYLRTEALRRHQYSLILYTPIVYAREGLTLTWIYGLYYGLMATVALYNLFLFLSIRDRSYLLYVLYVCLASLAQASMDGLAFMFLWPHATRWVSYDMLVLAILGALCAIQFAREFLQTREQLPRYHAWISVLMALEGVNLLALLVDPPWLGPVMHFVLGMVVPPTVITAGILCWRRGFRPAKYFVMARAVLVISIVFMCLVGMDVFPANLLNLSALRIGSATEALLLSLALADRINSMKREKERAQAEAIHNMQRAEKLKDEFLANTSHELRTPLNGIIGLAESMSDGATGPMTTEQRKNLGMIVASARRLSNLVNDILDFSRLKERDLVLKSGRVDIRELAGVVVTLLTPEAERKGLVLRSTIEETIPALWGDENRIQQILYNLIGNAIKFTESGTVTLSARAGEGIVEISIQDTGIGIPEDKFELIFQSFEQVDASISREFGGTGLGLAITRQLVELQGGTIRVASRPGEGSRFTFSLPMDPGEQPGLTAGCVMPGACGGGAEAGPGPGEKQSWGGAGRNGSRGAVDAVEARGFRGASLTMPAGIAPEERFLEAEPSSGTFRILAVDDDPVNLQVLLNLLSLQSYVVLQATNGQQALDCIERSGKPDLVLLDIMMPRMSGLEVCRRIREKYPASELPIIFLTAKSLDIDLVEGLSIGANDYQTKPFSKQELLARIRNHIALSQMNAAYGRFVPREMLEILKLDTILDVKLGDQVQREMTIMFSDIRSFTTLSEGMSPCDNFNFLNSYLRRVTPAIRSNRGYIDKYIGDGIMALFPEAPEDALRAAIQMRQALRVYNRHRRQSGYAPIDIGIGLHTGALILGTIGDEQRMEGTVISDAVNLASRLESLTKLYGASVIVSGDALARIPDPGRYLHRSLGDVQVKGKSRSVRIFDVFEGDAERVRDLKARTLEAFEQGLERFMEKRYGEAVALFEGVIEIHPEDLAAQLYLQRARYMAEVAVVDGLGETVRPAAGVGRLELMTRLMAGEGGEAGEAYEH